MNIHLLSFLLLFELSFGCDFNHLTESELNKMEMDAEQFMVKLNKRLAKLSYKVAMKTWKHDTNLTDYNRDRMIEALTDLANFKKESWKKTVIFPWKRFANESLRRQFKGYVNLGMSVLPAEHYKRYEEVINQMEKIYLNVRVPVKYSNRTVDYSYRTLDPALLKIFELSRKPQRLSYYWAAWREQVGRPCRPLFEEYVRLSNEAAQLNGFESCTEMWNEEYEMNHTVFKVRMENFWRQIKPLYVELFSYVRHRLRMFYGEEYIMSKAPLPAHLVGDLWSQSWANIFSITAPFPEEQIYNVSGEMLNKGYNSKIMVKVAEDFYKSIGFDPLPCAFWTRSIFQRPQCRELICQPDSRDFSNGEDFRIKMCARMKIRDLFTIHHEVGRIHYFIQYKNLPHCFRKAANSAFLEAVGDAIGLSVSTPKHLRKLGLLKDDGAETLKKDINYLFSIALQKIASMPFAYIMDLYRWNIFDGKTNPMIYNRDWWHLSREYQGIVPERPRTEMDFDAAAKYQILSGTPYIRYFLSIILQFQFHKALCQYTVTEYNPLKPMEKPLFKCDIQDSKEAGKHLREMMALGSSKSWRDTLEKFTGSRKIDIGPLLEYFTPLYGWLKDYNDKNQVFRGWSLHPNTL